MNPFKKQTQPDLEMFVVHDSKVGNYKLPFLAQNRFEVLRDFDNMMRDEKAQKENQYATNAEDFSLFKIGEYDRKTGLLVPTIHEHIANLLDLRTAAQQKAL